MIRKIINIFVIVMLLLSTSSLSSIVSGYREAKTKSFSAAKEFERTSNNAKDFREVLSEILIKIRPALELLLKKSSIRKLPITVENFYHGNVTDSFRGEISIEDVFHILDILSNGTHIQLDFDSLVNAIKNGNISSAFSDQKDISSNSSQNKSIDSLKGVDVSILGLGVVGLIAGTSLPSALLPEDILINITLFIWFLGFIIVSSVFLADFPIILYLMLLPFAILFPQIFFPIAFYVDSSLVTVCLFGIISSVTVNINTKTYMVYSHVEIKDFTGVSINVPGIMTLIIGYANSVDSEGLEVTWT